MEAKIQTCVQHSTGPKPAGAGEVSPTEMSGSNHRCGRSANAGTAFHTSGYAGCPEFEIRMEKAIMGFWTLTSYENIGKSLTNAFPKSPQFLTCEVEINTRVQLLNHWRTMRALAMPCEHREDGAQGKVQQ